MNISKEGTTHGEAQEIKRNSKRDGDGGSGDVCGLVITNHATPPAFTSLIAAQSLDELFMLFMMCIFAKGKS